jgi:hypothetical protein
MDAPSTSINIELKEGAATIGTFGTTVFRNDINLANPPASGNHGFSITTPSSIKDNTPHTLSFWGKNNNGAFSDAELGNSPRTLTCAPPPPSWLSSNKDILAVNGTRVSPLPSISATNEANIASFSPIGSGTEITFAINLVNTGGGPFSGTLTIDDQMFNLTRPASGSFSPQLYCNNSALNNPASCSTILQAIGAPTYTQSTGQLQFQITTLPGQEIAPGDIVTITYTATTKPPTGFSGSIYRFINQVTVDGFTFQTPPVIVFKDLSVPIIREIQ